MNRSTKLVATLVVATLVVAASIGVAYAAPTVDTSGSDGTSTQSGVTDGSTITYNESQNSTLQYNATNSGAAIDNTSVKILQGSTTLEEFQNASDPSELSVVSTSSTGDHINLTLADDEDGYEGVEADDNENVTLEYRLINDTTDSNPDADSTNITVYWENDANQSFIRAEDNDTETGEPGFDPLRAAQFWQDPNTTDPAEVEHSIGVNGNDQDDITIWIENSDAADALVEVEKDADDAAGVSYLGSVEVEGAFVPVLSDSADAPGWLDTDEEAYATVAEDGERVTVKNAGDILDSETTNATVVVRGNEQMDISQISGMLSNYDASGTTAWITAVSQGEVAVAGDQFEG